MRRRTAIPALLLAGLACAGGPATAAKASPQRVVSLNLCSDQLAVLLLPAERIAALSFLSRDPGLSYVADRAQAFPVVQGHAEEVLALRPDLVLAGRYSTRATVALLRSRGVPVLELDLADDFDAIRGQVTAVAEALGVPETGAALLDAMDSRLAAARPTGPDRPTALTLAPGGFTAGSGTLADAVMQAAGLSNHAASKGLAGYGYLSVETVAHDPPALLLADTDQEDRPSLAGQLLRHPALARGRTVTVRADLPGALVSCGGPFTAEAVTLLADLRGALRPPTESPQVAQRGSPP